MKGQGKIDELLRAKLKTEEVRLWGEGIDFFITAKQSLMDDFRFNRQMGIPMDEQKILNRIYELREKIAEMSGLHISDRTTNAQLLSLNCTSDQNYHS